MKSPAATAHPLNRAATATSTCLKTSIARYGEPRRWHWRSIILAGVLTLSANTTGKAADAATPDATAQYPLGIVPEAQPGAASGLRLLTNPELTSKQAKIFRDATITGDWNGLRSNLKDRGVTLDLGVTEFVQGNMLGGIKGGWFNVAKLDFISLFDLDKIFHWPGATFGFSMTYRNGNGANGLQGALIPVDEIAVQPFPPGQNHFALPVVKLVQQLFNDHLTIGIGHSVIRPLNTFAHDERYQFINNAFNGFPTFTTIPTQAGNEVDATITFTDNFSISGLIVDAESQMDHLRTKTLVSKATSYTEWLTVTVAPKGTVGHYRFGASQLDRAPSLEALTLAYLLNPTFAGLPLSQITLPTVPPGPTRGSDWLVFADIDQYLYKPKPTEDRGFAAFTKMSYTDGVKNPQQFFIAPGVAQIGLIPSRPDDTLALAYYYLRVSRHIPPSILKDLRDEQGFEIYYNFKLRPGVNITPDLQVILPASKLVETAVIGGLRVQLWF